MSGLVGLEGEGVRENGLRCRSGLEEQAGEEVGSPGGVEKRRESPRHAGAGRENNRRDAEAQSSHNKAKDSPAFHARPQRQGRVGG